MKLRHLLPVALALLGLSISPAISQQQYDAGGAARVSPHMAQNGGALSYGLQSGASTNSTSVAAGTHTLTALNLINTTTTIYYLRMYDSATAPTCSSATGFKRTWPIPPAAAAGGAAGIAANIGSTGTQFAAGIGFCLTGGPSSTDNTNAATGVFVNMDYR